jgi:flagellar basal body rod protein FlgC
MKRRFANSQANQPSAVSSDPAGLDAKAGGHVQPPVFDAATADVDRISASRAPQAGRGFGSIDANAPSAQLWT